MLRLKPIKPNMTEIHVGNVTVLFSYETPVACHVEGQGFFKTSEKHSSTTSRHISQWLNGANAAEKPQEWFNGFMSILVPD